MATTEIEIKIDLQNEANYRRLLSHFPKSIREIKQENYFFDTAGWTLTRVHWAVRIRLENDVAEMTIKGPAELTGDQMVIRPEFVSPIPRTDAAAFIHEGIPDQAALPPPLKAPLAGIVVFPLLYRLGFTNYRRDIPYDTGSISLRLEVDRTVFSDNSTAFELEIELSDPAQFAPARHAISTLFNTLQIPLNFHTESKLARALHRIIGKGFD